MNSPRLLVFAYSDLGHACLKFLLNKAENVAAVYTHQDNPHEKIWFPSVLSLAKEKNMTVRTPADLKTKDELDAIRKISPDLIFSFYYRYMIPSEILKLPTLGAYNMHGSLLPKYRGRAPVNWAVLHGEKETGATLHVMVEKPDAGDIVDQEAVPIGPEDTAAQVQTRVTQAAVTVLSRQIENLKRGKAPQRPQDASLATYFGRRRPEDGKIDWHRPAQDIHNLIRAVTHPYPGAFTDIFGIHTYIWRTRLVEGAVPPLKPGEWKQVDGRLFIGCGDGRALDVLEAEEAKRNEL